MERSTRVNDYPFCLLVRWGKYQAENMDDGMSIATFYIENQHKSKMTLQAQCITHAARSWLWQIRCTCTRGRDVRIREFAATIGVEISPAPTMCCGFSLRLWHVGIGQNDGVRSFLRVYEAGISAQ